MHGQQRDVPEGEFAARAERGGTRIVRDVDAIIQVCRNVPASRAADSSA